MVDEAIDELVAEKDVNPVDYSVFIKEIYDKGNYLFEDPMVVNYIHDSMGGGRTSNGYNKLPPLSVLSNNVFNIYPIVEVKTSCQTKDEWSYLKSEAVFKSGFLDDYKNHVHMVFTVGQENLLLATVGREGHVNFSFPVLRKLTILIGAEKIEKLVNLIFSAVEKSLEKFFKFQVNEMDEKGITNNLLVTVLTNLSQKLKSYSYEIGPRDLVQFITEIINNLFFYPEDLSSNMNNFLFLKNNLYRKTIATLLRKNNGEIRNAFQRGLSIGSKFFNALKILGYKIEGDNSVWVKDINLIPEFFLYGRNKYRLKESHREFHLKRVGFDPARFNSDKFHFLAMETNHPNVSSGVVCVGDQTHDDFRRLLLNTNTTSDDFCNFLINVENTISVINFDSSYIGIHVLGKDDAWKSKSEPVGVEGENVRTSARKVLRRV